MSKHKEIVLLHITYKHMPIEQAIAVLVGHKQRGMTHATITVTRKGEKQ